MGGARRISTLYENTWWRCDFSWSAFFVRSSWELPRATRAKGYLWIFIWYLTLLKVIRVIMNKTLVTRYSSLKAYICFEIQTLSDDVCFRVLSVVLSRSAWCISTSLTVNGKSTCVWHHSDVIIAWYRSLVLKYFWLQVKYKYCKDTRGISNDKRSKPSLEIAVSVTDTFILNTFMATSSVHHTNSSSLSTQTVHDDISRFQVHHQNSG